MSNMQAMRWAQPATFTTPLPPSVCNTHTDRTTPPLAPAAQTEEMLTNPNHSLLQTRETQSSFFFFTYQHPGLGKLGALPCVRSRGGEDGETLQGGGLQTGTELQ